MVFNLVFDTAEFVNIVVGTVGAEALSRFVDRVIKSNGSMRHLAKRIDRRSGGLITDRRAFVELISEVATWEAFATDDPAVFEPFAQRFTPLVSPGSSSEEYQANCRKVAEAIGAELQNTLTFIEQLQLKIYGNTSTLLGDLNELSLSLEDQLGDLSRRLDEALEKLLPTEFGGLAGMSPELTRPVDRAVAAVIQIHREACMLAGPPDPWQIRNMDRTVLKQMLSGMSRLFEPSPTPGERLLLHVIPLYIDAVLRLEAAERKEALAGRDAVASRIIRADLVRVRSAVPGIAKRVDSDHDSPLTAWLAHQATLLSPSVWESWTAYRLAAAIADLIEEQPPRREAVATLIRRLGRNAAYDIEEFDAQPWSWRLPECTESLKVNPTQMAALTRFVWHAIVDPRRAGLRLAEHLAMSSDFMLDTALDDLHSAQWDVDGSRLELDAWCSHPAVALALIGHAAQVDRELDDLRRERALPVRAELRVGSARVRPRMRANGRPEFELPLIQLQLSQQETRQLLMGTALYGRPELAVREMYQNALDACRYRAVRREYLDRTKQGGFPQYLSKIEFSQEPAPDGGSIIECRDNGVGMSYVELRDAFAQAGRRFTDLASFQDEQARWTAEDADLRLYPNSRFGIGVFSYFMLADEVEVTTVRQNPDGSLGTPLHVRISALSGLLTVSELEEAPPAVANGGTVVHLAVPGTGPDNEAVYVSVSDLLEDLVWYSDAEVVVAEADRPELIWKPGELGGVAATTAMLAFHTDECRGWWTQGDGAVLADGIQTDVALPGVIVDLRGSHAPALRADRNEVLGWDKQWVMQQFVAAAKGIVDWADVSLVWLWRIALAWPRVGHAMFAVLAERGNLIAVGLKSRPGASVNPRAAGCLPLDHNILETHDTASPFTRPLAMLVDEGSAWRLDRVEWPTTLRRWRERLWPRLLATEAETIENAEVELLRRPVGGPVDVHGLPVPTALDSALLCGIHSGSVYPTYPEPRFVGADTAALVAGAARIETRLADAVRRVRRYHIAAVVLPDVDAREIDPPSLDRDTAEQVIAGSVALGADRNDPSSRGEWASSAIAAAYNEKRPLKAVWRVLDAMGQVGHPALLDLPIELADRVPTLREVGVLAVSAWSVSGLMSRAQERGIRRTEDLVRLLLPYERLLRDVGVDLEVLRRLANRPLGDDERIAWSANADGQEPWLYGQQMPAIHPIRVARQLGVTVAAAWDLISTCPDVNLGRWKERPADEFVDEQDADLAASWFSWTQKWYFTLNSLAIVDWARDRDTSIAEAAERLVRLGVPGFPNFGVDWDYVENFRVTYQQRELVVQRLFGTDEAFPYATVVGPGRLVACAAVLRIGLTQLAEAATALEALGIRCTFPPRPGPVEQPTEVDAATVVSLLRTGKRHLASALADLTERVPELAEARFHRVLGWMCWLWWDDAHVQQVLAVAGSLGGALRDRMFDEIAPDVLERLELIAGSPEGRIHRAHLIEVAGSIGVSLTRLQAAVAPFDAMFAAQGWDLPWFDDPLDTPPDWLDVIVVSLVVAYGEEPQWTAGLADFLAGNVDAPMDAVKACWTRWAARLHADPQGWPSQTSAESSGCTGMVRWVKAPRRTAYDGSTKSGTSAARGSVVDSGAQTRPTGS
jgi:hypothetical protein